MNSISFSAVGMWERDGLYVHPCGRFLEGEAEDLALPTRTVRVASRESLIVDRIASFRHLFRHKAVDPAEGYELALQGLEMLAAFEGELNGEWSENELERRGALNIYRELRALLERTDEHTVGKEDLRDVLDSVGIHPPDVSDGEEP